MPDGPLLPEIRAPFLVRILTLRNLLITVGVVSVLTGLTWVAAGLHRRWSENRLVNQAVAFLEKGDYASAVARAREALLANPANVGACRVMADAADRVGAPEASFWRARTSELDPADSVAALNWAATALRCGDTAAADQALQRVKGEARRTHLYHQVAGGLALATTQHALAEAHFAMALKLQPSNHSDQINLFTLQLRSDNAANAAAARLGLDQLRLDPQVRVLALRALLSDALARLEMQTALKYARELNAAPESLFRDQLLCLGVLRRVGDPGFEAGLEGLKSRTLGHPGNLYDMVSWMNANGLSGAALDWLRSLPPLVRNRPAVAMAMAEATVLQKDWTGLRLQTAAQQWGPLDCLRIAYKSRASRELGGATANLEWKEAVRVAGDSPRQTDMLVKLADAWGWETEAMDALWAQAGAAPNPRLSLISLYRRYHKRNDTRGLREVTRRIVELDPTDLAALNNLASFSLLLDVDRVKAGEMARAVHAKNPLSAIAITTYGLSLHLQGKSAEAVRLMDALNEEVLREPSVAAYYGIFLAATGAHEKAAKYLELAAKAPLLPEEKRLVEKAARQVAARRKSPAP